MFKRFKSSDIKIIRNKLQITQKVLGEWLGVTSAMVAMWESNRRKISYLHFSLLKYLMQNIEKIKKFNYLKAIKITASTLKGIRKRLNLSQKQFADKLKVSESLVSMWEIKKRKISKTHSMFLGIYLFAIKEIQLNPIRPSVHCVFIEINKAALSKIKRPRSNDKLINSLKRYLPDLFFKYL